MSEKIWTIEVCIIGAFFLVKKENLKLVSPSHPLVRKLHILPEFDQSDRQTGVFNIKIDFGVEAKGHDGLDAEIIADQARDIIDYYLNLLTFLSGSEVKKKKPIILKHEYPEGGRFRQILYAETANLIPPVPLVHTHLFKAPIESKISRSLTFYSYGVREKDIIVSTYFLLSALDMIATQFKVDVRRTRKCESCGFAKDLEASSADRIKYVITQIAGLPEEDFKIIWDIRNSIFHGYFSINAKNVRGVIDKRAKVRFALIRAIKNLMGLKDSDLPIEKDPNWFADPLMDLEYISK